MARPGRKPTDPRKLDVKLEFASDEEGQQVRNAGGGPWIMELIQHALGNIPEPQITAEISSVGDSIEIRILIPRAAIPDRELNELEQARQRRGR